MSLNVDERVTTLEKALESYIKSSEKIRKDLTKDTKYFRDGVQSFMDEMKEFKNEMSDFKDEMSDFKDEMIDFKDEMIDFKDEMSDFKDEMSDFKDEMRVDRKRMNKQWGELANKMGTVLEDIFFPGIRPVLESYFNSSIDSISIRNRRYSKLTGLRGEFDIVATDQERVYLVDVKSTPDKDKIMRFVESVIPRFRRFYPEHGDKKLIPIFGSLYFSESLIPFASEAGVYLLSYREWEYLDFLNFDQINSATD